MAETVSLRNLNIPLPSVAAHIAPSLVREKESILFLVFPVFSIEDVAPTDHDWSPVADIEP